MDKAELHSYLPLSRELKQLEHRKKALTEKLRRFPTEGTPGYCEAREALRQTAELYESELRDSAAELLRIETAIRDLSDPEERTLLRYRYLDGLDWPEIEDRMHYSERSVHRIHGRALYHVEEV